MTKSGLQIENQQKFAWPCRHTRTLVSIKPDDAKPQILIFLPQTMLI